MILLTKINNNPIAVNSDLIEYIEETPDTVITLTNSDRVVVQEGMTEIIREGRSIPAFDRGTGGSGNRPAIAACETSGQAVRCHVKREGSGWIWQRSSD